MTAHEQVDGADLVEEGSQCEVRCLHVFITSLGKKELPESRLKRSCDAGRDSSAIKGEAMAGEIRMKTVRLGLIALACGLAVICADTAGAKQEQQQEVSVAELARRLREQKKSAPEAKQVWTNDNLPQVAGAPVNVVGRTAQPRQATPGETEASGPEAAAGKGAKSADKEKGKDRAEAEAELAQEKQHLETAKHELDLLQRDLNLHRQQFYSDPGYASNTEGKAALDEFASQVEAKRQEVQQTEQKIAALEGKLESMNHELGAKKEEPITPEKEHESWLARVRPLRQELERVEAELQRVRAEADARGMTLYGVTAGGSMTANQLQQLENRRANLQQQIAAIEDEARRAGVPTGWLR